MWAGCRHKVSRFLLVATRRWSSDACSLVKRQFMAILPPLIALIRTREEYADILISHSPKGCKDGLLLWSLPLDVGFVLVLNFIYLFLEKPTIINGIIATERITESQLQVFTYQKELYQQTINSSNSTIEKFITNFILFKYLYNHKTLYSCKM